MSWQRQQEHGSVLGMRFLIGVYKLLGAKMCCLITYPVLRYFYWINRNVRQALRDYYRHLQHVDDQIVAAPFANIKQFGFGIIDRLSLWMGDSRRIAIVRHNHEVLYSRAKSGKGGIIFSSHLGNFELSRAAGREKLPAVINVIVDYENAKKINATMKAVNNDFMANIIPVEHIDITLAIQLKEKIDDGEFIVIAADRTNQKSAEHSLSVPFLGQDAAFPTGPYILAKVLGCPVFTLYAFRRGLGKYEIYFHQLFERVELPNKSREMKIKQYMAQYAEQLESYCRRYPDQWFNFYHFWQKPLHSDNHDRNK